MMKRDNEHIESYVERLESDISRLRGLVAEAHRTGYMHGARHAEMCVLDLLFAFREIKGKPTLKDLVKLAKRIRSIHKPREESKLDIVGGDDK